MSSSPATRTPAIRIIWAVDATDDAAGPVRAMGAVLRHLIGYRPARVLPVHVLGGDRWRALGAAPASRRLVLERIAAETIRRRLAGAGVPGLRVPEILIPRQPSLRDAARTLVARARQERADLIAVATHARSGWPRLVLGSFAETLMLTGGASLLTINPMEAGPVGRRVLFASDLSPASRKTFRRLLRLAARLHLQVTIYHQLGQPMLPAMGAAEPFAPQDYRYLDAWYKAEKTRALRLGAGMVRQARRSRVRSRFVLGTGLAGIGSEVLAAARRARAGYLAVGLHPGPLPILLGRVARYTVRHARTPVLVLEP